MPALTTDTVGPASARALAGLRSIPTTAILIEVDQSAVSANDDETGYAVLVSDFYTRSRSAYEMPPAFTRDYRPLPDLLGASSFVTCGFEMDVHLTATLASAPACAHLLHACGFRGETSDDQLEDYFRVAAPLESISVFYFDLARKAIHRLRVAAAGYVVEAVAGERVTLRFELAGIDRVITPAELPLNSSITGFLGARAC